MTPSGWDASVWYTASPSACGNPAACVNGADSHSSGTAETLVINGVADTTYYLIVDSYSGTVPGGPFTIAVN